MMSQRTKNAILELATAVLEQVLDSTVSYLHSRKSSRQGGYMMMPCIHDCFPEVFVVTDFLELIQGSGKLEIYKNTEYVI